MSAIALLKMIYSVNGQWEEYGNGVTHSDGGDCVVLESRQLVGRVLVGKLEVELLLRQLALPRLEIANQSAQLLRVQLGDVLHHNQIVASVLGITFHSVPRLVLEDHGFAQTLDGAAQIRSSSQHRLPNPLPFLQLPVVIVERRSSEEKATR